MTKISRTEPLLLDGKALSKKIRDGIAAEVSDLRRARGRAPGLGVILVGDNPASKAYVANKEKLAVECGFETFDQKLPATATFDEVREAILAFNSNEGVDGILLQLPLPRHLNSDDLISLIDPTKDADGLHPINQGLLLQGRGGLRPCTPLGVMRLIELAQRDLTGVKAVVVGRSILVGKPVALLLLEKHATVVMAHSRTKDLPAVVGDADIVVAAVGVPELVRGEWIKEGAIVIDVGINRTEAGTLVGDVHFQSACTRASAITPVPGGVGPMTIAMLLENTLRCFKERTK